MDRFLWRCAVFLLTHNLTQYSKLLNELPPVDIVITMGCNAACPYLPCKHREDWCWTIRLDTVMA